MSSRRDRTSSVSFTRSQINEAELTSEDENIQITLAPYIQTYLAHVSHRNSCFGKFLPIPFERASKNSWWDPRFDSEILEGQFKASAYPQLRLRFRYALLYILLVSLTWFIYFLVTGLEGRASHWSSICSVLASLIVVTVCLFLLTQTEFYHTHLFSISFCVALLLCILSIVFIYFIPTHFTPTLEFSSDMSLVGQFSMCGEILLLEYTVLSLPLYISVIIGIFYSIAFELLTWSVQGRTYVVNYFVIVRWLVHLCIHLIGLHILIMTNVRLRGTFMKVGQSLLVRRQLEMEKQLKEKMILSVMPPKVADWLLNDDAHFHRNSTPRNSNTETNDLKSLFRPFNMNCMENVSILFADIVGFTRMSSNKSAEELVAILNDLFERFDGLCSLHNCEKISTLGDCYYCVSGCPEPRPDHARCCVEMGLGMIQAIKQFDKERNEGVNMRVGIHTGTVLCGIVGTRRFKFDVWSNDVTLANRMESTGRPGMVHISESTCAFLQDMYLLEESEDVCGLKTYFILGRKSDLQSYSGSFQAVDSQAVQPKFDSLQLIISPPTSPPSMSPQTRPRVLSYTAQQDHLKPHSNPNQLSPNIFKIKASSLPSILDSEGEAEADHSDSGNGNSEIKSPTSAGSYGKYSSKIKNWKVPKFLRRQESLRQEQEQAASNAKGDNDSHSSNGYQQVPAIIETSLTRKSSYQNTQNSLSGNGMRKDSSWTSFSKEEHKRSISLEEQKNEIIDIKSYISQSRSDVGGQFDISPSDLSHFIRSGSYRSQYGRSPNELSLLERSGSNRSRHSHSANFDIVPPQRARSATATSRIDMDCLEVPGSAVLDDGSVCMSVNSRKDSGIRSNSRRSSIQQQIFVMNQSPLPPADLLQHRVSGYYTSSQSTLNSCSPQYASRIPAPFYDPFGACFQKLRKQSDLQLIRCVQDNSKSRSSYFMKPPISHVTLFFKDRKMEEEYRENVHSISDRDGDILPTLATSRYNTYFDIFISAVVFIIVCTSLFILYTPSVLWVVVFVMLLVLELCAVSLCLRKSVKFAGSALTFCSQWYRWHTFGAIIVSIPVVAILSNFSCQNVTSTYGISDNFYNYLLFIGIVHFCNFTQLNCWMKNVLVTFFTVIFLLLVVSLGDNCTMFESSLQNDVGPDNLTSILDKNFTEPIISIQQHLLNLPNTTTFSSELRSNSFLYHSEIYIDIFLLLVLVWFLNREFEISYRLSFHANFVADKDKIHVQSMKNQADWLLHNIIPKHVADQLKKCAKYSENHKDVGIIFASIVNFNEMYDESYLGGKEFLRVLNELIGDFDELLLLPEFRSVDKIKTIGSTFMAASGLNPEIRREYSDPHHHLYALMDFAIAMQKVIDNFNRDLLEFNLILRVGYNFGDVTAGVIGTSKLYYDIWGDAVNIASRMDSTGVNGRIQVGGACLDVLEKQYEFEPRGSVYVKGKDNMEVYLLLRKKERGDT